MGKNTELETSSQVPSNSEHFLDVKHNSYGEEHGSPPMIVWCRVKYGMKLIGTLIIAGLLAAAVAYTQSILASALEPQNASLPVMPSYRLAPGIAHNLGAYSARYVVPSPISADVPQGCDVAMINVLQRHGARYPTTEAGVNISNALVKVKSAYKITNPALEFVSSFNYSYIPEQLVWFGRNQSYISGQIISRKYAALGNSSFVRAAHLPRINESSRWWRQGFENRSFNVPIHDLPQADLVISTINNTLFVETCTNAKDDPERGRNASQLWISHFAPNITTRLNNDLRGANLTDSDTLSLMSLCGFDTAAKNGTASPWCSVFTESEFESYEYSGDLQDYYSRSYGSAYARSEGVGWVNELLARLNGKPVCDNTTTDTTLDSNPMTFPYGPSAPKIFADFSSDNNIAMILSAMGVLRDSVDLPQTGPMPPNRLFYISKLVPFAGLTVVEKLTCPTSGAALKGGEYVRIIINDAVIPLDFPSCGVLGLEHGICSLGGFNSSQAFAQAGGNWTSCFTNNLLVGGPLL